MEKILISACLVGDKTRYDSKGNYNPNIKKLLEFYELVPFCPEVEGGLPTPRKRNERRKNEVVNEDIENVTKQFNDGAQKALNICKYLNIHIAILKENSPSCGVHQIYNGYFQNKKVPGVGWTTELLMKNDIKVYNEDEIIEFLKPKIEHQRKIEEIKNSENKLSSTAKSDGDKS